MKRFRQAVTISLLVMSLLSMLALTGCWQHQVILSGNQAVKLQKGESAKWSGWLIQDEALARILEKAEVCQAKKP